MNKNVYVDWRASQGNLDHIASLLVRYPNSWLQNIKHGLQKRLRQGKNYYREYFSYACDLKNDCPHAHAVNVIVIIDARNASAALDFIDELKMMTTNLILIGQTTKADRLYMEVRSVSLPSGLGVFFFPIKVYRNRARWDNQPYKPNIQYTDLDDTPALQNFILQQIKEKKIGSAVFSSSQQTHSLLQDS